MTTKIRELIEWMRPVSGGDVEALLSEAETELDSLERNLTSVDVERAATLAWNEAVEACAKAAGTVPVSTDPDDVRWDAVSAIRALKRTT